MHEASLRHLIQSPRLVGRVPLAVRDEKGRTVRYDVDPSIPVDPESVILSTMVWQQAREKLTTNGTTRTWTEAGGWGRAFRCYQCDARLYYDKSLHSYRCEVHHEGRPVVSRAKADAFVEQAFLARWGTHPVSRVEVVGDITDKAERLAVLAESIDATTLAMRTPGADIAALAQQVAQLHQDREQVQAEPEEASVRRIETGEDIAAYWARVDEAGRLALLVQSIGVRVHPGSREGGRFEALPTDENVKLQAPPRKFPEA